MERKATAEAIAELTSCDVRYDMIGGQWRRSTRIAVAPAEISDALMPISQWDPSSDVTPKGWSGFRRLVVVRGEQTDTEQSKYFCTYP
jgi:hypothetical protein